MTIDEFIINIENLFDKKNELKPESVFFDMVEWSSFNQLLLVNFINEEFDLKMKVSELKPFMTIKGLFELIINN